MDQRSESDTEATLWIAAFHLMWVTVQTVLLWGHRGGKFFQMNNNFLKIYFVILSDLVIIHP